MSPGAGSQSCPSDDHHHDLLASNVTARAGRLNRQSIVLAKLSQPLRSWWYRSESQAVTSAGIFRMKSVWLGLSFPGASRVGSLGSNREPGGTNPLLWSLSAARTASFT